MTALQIRDAQIQTLAADARRRFEAGACARLRAAFPDATRDLSDAALAHLVTSGVDRAEAHGFLAPAHVGRYLDYVVLLGLDFEANPEHAEVTDILQDADLNGAEKVAWIDAALAGRRA